MQRKHGKKSLSFILCMVLIVAMALFTTGCNGKTGNADGATSTSDGEEMAVLADGSVLGNGEKVFPLTVVDKEGKEIQFEIHTDKTTVGDALMELGLIAGEEGQYGLFVKTVNGVTVDYDTDGVYWAFYINGEYAQTGVDATEIKEGENYSFQVE